MVVEEKNRLNTEQKLYNALEEIIIADGFEKLGVNAVANKASVSKILIYRYFESLDNMIAEYLSKKDFLINYNLRVPDKNEVIDYIKGLFKEQINDLRINIISTRILRWELNTSNSAIEKLRLKREAKSLMLVTIISQVSMVSQEYISSLFVMLNATISYLVILKETCPIYNGIDLQSEHGWMQINKMIDDIIDKWFL